MSVSRVPPYPPKPHRKNKRVTVVLRENGKSCEPDVEVTPDSKCIRDHSPHNKRADPETRSPTTEVSTKSPDDLSHDSSIDVTALVAIGDEDEPLVDSTHKTPQGSS